MVEAPKRYLKIIYLEYQGTYNSKLLVLSWLDLELYRLKLSYEYEIMIKFGSI